MVGRVWIGTSGWSYKHWEHGVFYPEGLKQIEHLPFYAEHLPTVELNASFYRLPKPSFVEGWYDRTPAGFRFAVKLSRWITHRKRLDNVAEDLQRFFRVLDGLRDKRGPLLIQFSPATRRSDDLLRNFLQNLRETIDPAWKPSIELRHKSWITDEVYDILTEANVGVVVHDMPGSKTDRPNNVPFVYIRRHGSTGRYAGSYSDEKLLREADLIRQWTREGRDVYVYFNNDVKGYAVKNAIRLQQLIGQ